MLCIEIEHYLLITIIISVINKLLYFIMYLVCTYLASRTDKQRDSGDEYNKPYIYSSYETYIESKYVLV